MNSINVQFQFAMAWTENVANSLLLQAKHFFVQITHPFVFLKNF